MENALRHAGFGRCLLDGIGHPRTSTLVADAIQKAAAETGMPEGVFHLVNDVSVEAGTALVVHPAIKAVGFTGSVQAGRALFNLAAGRRNPIPVFAEMSSLNPLIVMPGALRERQAEIIRGLTGSVTLGVGQFCTKPGVVLGLRGPELECFEAGLADAFAKVPPGRMLHRGIKERLAGSLGKTQDFIRFSGAGHLLVASAKDFKTNEVLHEEIFGPATLIIECADQTELLDAAQRLDGQLTATVHLAADEHEASRPLLEILAQKAGRLIIDGYPTGVEVCPSMQHGGPYPATTDARFTSVGTAAVQRFARPVCYQSFPEALLPPELHNANRCRIWRQINGKLSKEDVGQ
jgi:2,5-dioxopentanoate dehydrogenase